MIRWKTLMCVVLLVCAAAPCSLGAQERSQRTVVLLLFDGWAPALFDTVPTPVMARMRREGAWSHHMLPAFPSLSLVNQVTISTGCWPEHHGIVSNEFVDPVRGRYDHSSDADWLTGCEHLHQVAERQGITSAALGWVGRMSSTRGRLAKYVSEEKTFAEFPSDPERAAEVVRLLRLPDAERPRLILSYFKGPDSAEHFTGMDSEQTRQAVLQSDAIVGTILDAITALPFHDQVTLIVTTDHGMLPVWVNINISKILRDNDIDATAVSSGTTSFLYFKDPSRVSPAASALARYYRFFEVWSRNDHPGDWHIGKGARLGDLIVSALPPNFIEDVGHWPVWLRWLGRWGPERLWSRFVFKATHGYPAKTHGMPGIFYAWGAGIAAGHEVLDLRAVDIHPTVCRLLGIQPGSLVDGQVVSELLAE